MNCNIFWHFKLEYHCFNTFRCYAQGKTLNNAFIHRDSTTMWSLAEGTCFCLVSEWKGKLIRTLKRTSALLLRCAIKFLNYNDDIIEPHFIPDIVSNFIWLNFFIKFLKKLIIDSPFLVPLYTYRLWGLHSQRESGGLS